MLRQSFTDLELLIIDDGSSDRTLDVAQSCAARDPRVRVLRQPHAGPGPEDEITRLKEPALH